MTGSVNNGFYKSLTSNHYPLPAEYDLNLINKKQQNSQNVDRPHEQ